MMLFYTTAFYMLALRTKYPDPRLSYLAAFFVGIAVGVKYQAIIFLPIFFIAAKITERSISICAKSFLIFILIGSMWYARNLWISGDPIHPLGGHYFGFWLWNAEDIDGQFKDLANRRSLPQWYFWPAMGIIFFWRKAEKLIKATALLSAISVIIWYIVVGYLRYLAPVYPLLGIISAYVIVQAWNIFANSACINSILTKIPFIFAKISSIVLMLLLVAGSFIQIAKALKKFILLLRKDEIFSVTNFMDIRL